MTSPSRLKSALSRGELILGSWLSLASPAAAEVLSHCGFRWLLIDQQHSAVGPDGLIEMLRAVEAGGASPVVRVPTNRPEYIATALDAGAHAVMVPMVSSADDAEEAVRSLRYPPAGSRSIGGYRAALAAGLTRADYHRQASDRTSAWVQIEDARAVESIHEIVQVDGIDVCFVGPQDLSASLGLSPAVDPESELFEAALDRIVQAAKGTAVLPGLLVPDHQTAARRWAQGFRAIAVSTDATMLADAGRRAAGQHVA